MFSGAKTFSNEACSNEAWGIAMKPSLSSAFARPNGNVRQPSRTAYRIFLAMPAFVALAACEQNSFVPPPPSKVDVALPQQRLQR